MSLRHIGPVGRVAIVPNTSASGARPRSRRQPDSDRTSMNHNLLQTAGYLLANNLQLQSYRPSFRGPERSDGNPESMNTDREYGFRVPSASLREASGPGMTVRALLALARFRRAAELV